MKNQSCEAAFAEAKKVIPGGVNSPVRAFAGVGGTPIMMRAASGAYLYDIENNRYIDYVGSFGPMIAGHAHAEIVKAVQKACADGLSFGAPTEVETQLAELIVDRVASVEMVRMCNSGTEATMSAIRLARAYAKRSDVVKFAGCYHGHSDGLLVSAGSGALTLNVPDSPGVPEAYARHTLTLPYNDIQALEALFEEKGNTLAAVIVEPIAGNMNCVPPKVAFLNTLRELCTQYGVVLIFDEVMTGFRVAKGGAQELFGIEADLTTFGKVIGGGMPVGAFGGRAEIMSLLAPLGGVYQAGTLSGNPVAMAAGIANMNITAQAGFYEDLAQKTHYFVEGVRALGKKHQIDVLVQSVCGMVGLFFTTQTVVENLEQAKACDSERFAKFFHLMLENGVYLAPSAFETLFISAAHSQEILDETLQAMDKVFSILKD